IYRKHRESYHRLQGGLKGDKQEGKEDLQATGETFSFLGPEVHGKGGAARLAHTLEDPCDFLPDQFAHKSKMVHAIAVSAPARFVVDPTLKRIDREGHALKGFADRPNPWSGLLSSKNAGKRIPMFMRFSIANPVLGSVQWKGQELLLEFIPGLGLKFFIDKHE